MSPQLGPRGAGSRADARRAIGDAGMVAAPNGTWEWNYDAPGSSWNLALGTR
eukprot:gene11555-biopygen4128